MTPAAQPARRPDYSEQVSVIWRLFDEQDEPHGSPATQSQSGAAPQVSGIETHS